MPRLFITYITFLTKNLSCVNVTLGLLIALFFSSCTQSEPAPDLFSLPTIYKVGKKPDELRARDMNLDGFPDILVSNAGSDTLSYFEAIGDGTFKTPFTMNTGREPLAFEIGDFNGD
ncbi:uncharacterized protein METZ01_LOCUS218380, partial [marine metagenome]